MSMTITFGTTSDPKNKLNKTYKSSVSITGNLKDDTSVVNPIILVNASLATLSGCNYMYIASFGRYYYITDVVSKGANLVEVHGHCDVLKSFNSQIRACTGYVSRTNTGNSYISDDMKALTNKPTVTYVNATGQFGYSGFVLWVGGKHELNYTPKPPSSEHSSSSHNSEEP